MALSSGDRLGRYEVLGPLGAGGMGEVYRARDTELEREVAVKVLPTSVANDPDRLARFQREARAVAALSHPNILEIFDVGMHNGLQYAVIELLEGQTLRERLPRKGIPWQKVVEIGASIAEGLAAAHGKGIVHRDLKPENIFVTSDGRVKVLDFGLARIETEISQEAETATLTPAGTVTGTIMGTPGYMAPEQVRGKVADHRSDIFALGCVLYEMVVGRRAFGGDTTPDTMAAILKEEPPRPSATGTALPIDLERTIHRCLEKSPEARFQSAADLAYNLKSTATGSAVPMATPTGEVRPVTRRWWPVAVAVGAVLAGASLVAWLNLRSGEESIVEAPADLQATPSPFLDEWRVAVEPFDNRTGDPALDAIGRTLTDRVMEGLARIDQGIESLTPITVLAADASGVEGSLDERPSQKIGRLLVTGSYSEKAPAFEVIVQVRDPDTRGVLYSTGSIVVSRSVGDAELTPLLGKVMGAVGIHVHIRLENVSHIPDYTVFREYIGGVEGLWSRRDPKQADRIDRAIEMDPEFLEPVFWKTGSALIRSRPEEAAPLIDHIRLRLQRLTEHENLWLTMFEAEFDEAPARAIRSARDLQTVAPHDFLVRFYHARLAGDLGEYEEVVETLAGVIEHLPRSYGYLRVHMPRQLIWAYHELERFEETLALARRLRRENPGETQMYVYEANALAALGRLDELAETVAACEGVLGGECDAAFVLGQVSWHLAAHGHREAARSFALRGVEMYRLRVEESGATGFDHAYLYTLRAAELWDEYDQHARLGLEQFEEGSNGHKYARCAAGMAAAHLGDRTEAEAIMAQFLTEENSLYAGYVAAHLGELDRAVEYLKRSVASTPEVGYDQFLRWDLDLEPLWEYPPFREMVGWDD
jgi:serine/threonine protein kinase/tetratricopeptide (TPR) repeat protein